MLERHIPYEVLYRVLKSSTSILWKCRLMWAQVLACWELLLEHSSHLFPKPSRNNNFWSSVPTNRSRLSYYVVSVCRLWRRAGLTSKHCVRTCVGPPGWKGAPERHAADILSIEGETLFSRLDLIKKRLRSCLEQNKQRFVTWSVRCRLRNFCLYFVKQFHTGGPEWLSLSGWKTIPKTADSHW